MKMHIITIGSPKLPYAKLGWQEYWDRLQHFHKVRVTHIPDKHNNVSHIEQAIGSAYLVSLDIVGKQFSSIELAEFLEKRAQDSKEVCFVIGGPEGLPEAIRSKANLAWSLSDLTFPHDLAMVILLEALYRACTINSNTKYHK